jgi:hypothetical protein
MAMAFETGVFTVGASTPQTVSLADGSFGTPIAIILYTASQATLPVANSFNSTSGPNAIMSVGYGTRRSGSTQSGCVGIFIGDGVATGTAGRVRNTTILHVLSGETTTDYTVSLDSFGNAAFTVSFSSIGNAQNDIIHYAIWGGADLTDAIVLNSTLNSTGATQSITGAGFQGDVLFCLDSDLATTNTPTTNMAMSFGCADSYVNNFFSLAITATSGDTMTSNMNWNRAIKALHCIERLTINANTSDSSWDLDAFTSDGCTLGVNNAPSNTDRIATLLIIKGGIWSGGNATKNTGTGTQTLGLSMNGNTIRGVLFGFNSAALGIQDAVVSNEINLVFGFGSTANTTRGSAVNNVIGIAAPETISTTADRFRATDAVIEELTGGTSPAETSEAWFRSVGSDTFTIDWAVNGGSAHPLVYMAFGDKPIPGGPPIGTLPLMGVGR